MERPNLETIQHQINWDELKETILLLYLSVAQIDMSMKDGDGSINTLVDSFTSMSNSIKVIENAANEIDATEENSSDDLHEIKTTILTDSNIVAKRMQEAIIAFQFYDKLSQRLYHVSENLDELTELVTDKSRLYDKQEWLGLQDKIKSSHSMIEESELYDAIISGAGIEDAINLVRQKIEEKLANGGVEDDDEIDLF